MSDSPDDLLLDRYVAGECDPPERIRIDRLLAGDPALSRRAEQLRLLRDTTRQLPPSWDVDALWSELQQRITTRAAAGVAGEADVRPEQPRQSARRPARPRVAGMLPHGRRSRSRDAARIAAALAIAAGLGALWRAADRIGWESVARQRFEAQRGRLSTVRLADGTRVTLAAGSTLDVPETFDERRRDVFLAGQAYFEIATDSARPFRVHARNAVTEVLGTKFGVRAYAEDPAVTVVVAEGRVAVGASDPSASSESGRRARGSEEGASPPTLLTAGDRATLSRSGRVQVEHDVAVSRELAWMQGKLVFAGDPLGAVVREIERWYDVEIVVADSSLLAAPVHATFGVERVERVMRVLAGTLDAELEIRGDSAWLRRRR